MSSSTIVKKVLHLSLVAILTVLAGCASYMHGYTTSRYQGQWLKIDTSQTEILPGNKRLQMERDFDGALDMFILSKGIPDYIYVVDTEIVELAYIAEHKIYKFERPFFNVNSELKRVYSIDEVKGDTSQSKAFLVEVASYQKSNIVDGQVASTPETHSSESWDQDVEDKIQKVVSMLPQMDYQKFKEKLREYLLHKKGHKAFAVDLETFNWGSSWGYKKLEEAKKFALRHCPKHGVLLFINGELQVQNFESQEPLLWNASSTSQNADKLSSARNENSTGQDSESLLQASFKLELGNYHGLIIGINDYAHLPKLETAINDARKVEAILKKSYGFETQLLINPKRGEILRALNAYRGRLSPNDNFLIYYAGHGWLDRNADEGYWLPVNADADSNVNWLANSAITATLRAIESKHVLVVSDSCYSGKLSRGIIVKDHSPGYLKRIIQKRSRTVLSSGGLEPVADSSYGSKHSVFAKYFIQALLENDALIDGLEIYYRIKRSVIINSDQTPEYADIRKAGHDGGDFIFLRLK